MSFPVISDLALTTVDIDPYIEYTYVLPVTGETSCGFSADANFELAMAGRVLTLRYIGDFTSTEDVTEFPITLFASNGYGTTELIVTFRIGTYEYVNHNAAFTVSATSGSANIAFGSTIGDQLIVGDVVFLNQIGGAGGTFDDVTRYIVSVSGSNFQLSATAGGGPITAGGTLNYSMFVGVQAASNAVMWVGDTSGLVVGEPIQIATDVAVGDIFTVITPIPSIVKQIMDGHHIKTESVLSGSDIVPAANSAINYTSIYVRTYPRAYPVITSDPFLSVEPQGAVSFGLSCDLEEDFFLVKGLPVDLKLVGVNIQGRAPSTGYYPITIVCRLGITDSLSTMVLSIDET